MELGSYLVKQMNTMKYNDREDIFMACSTERILVQGFLKNTDFKIYFTKNFDL